MRRFFSKKNKKIAYLILLAIIFIGLLLRIHYALNDAYFVNDQGRDLLVLQKMLKRGYPVTIGPSTSFFTKYGNIPFGPYYYYFLFPFFLISKHPYFVTLPFILLFLIISLAVFKDKKLNLFQKFIFLTFFSLSLNSIYYTAFIWNLNLAMLLGFLIFLFYIKKERLILSSAKNLLLFGLVLGAIFQIHYALFFLVAGIFINFLKKSRKKALYFLLGFLASFFPFLIFELRHSFLISRMLLRLPFEAKENKLGVNIIQSLIDLSKFYFPFFINSKLIHLTIGLLLSILLVSYLQNYYTKLFFSIFLISFIFLRRNFTYYLALYLPFFYFQISTLGKNKILKILLFILAILTAIVSIDRYLKEKNLALGIKTQLQIARKISQKNQDKTLSLTVLPHNDDKNGVLYLLSRFYNFKIKDQDADKYIICFKKTLCVQKGEKIYQNPKVVVIYQRKFD